MIIFWPCGLVSVLIDPPLQFFSLESDEVVDRGSGGIDRVSEIPIHTLI